MLFFYELFHNQVLWAAILSWFIAQSLKVIFVLITEKRFDFHRFVGSGGMPSSHSSFVTSLAVIIGFDCGFDSAMFAVCVVLALIVMYDAAGVRRAAGKQASILNQIVEHWNDESPEIQGERLKELLGHTPFEVIAGAILGIAVAVALHICTIFG